MKLELQKNELKLGGKPYPGQLVREGHYPKFSAMIDELEEIAISYIGKQQYVDLFREIDRQQMEQFLQRYITKVIPDFMDGYSSSDSEISLNKRRSPSIFNTYHHLVTT